MEGKFLVRLRNSSLSFAWMLGAFFMGACGPLPGTQLTESERVGEMNWIIAKFEHNYAPLHYKEAMHGFKWEDMKAKYLEAAKKDQSNEAFSALATKFVAEFKDAHTSLIYMPSDILKGDIRVAYLGFETIRYKDEHGDFPSINRIYPTVASGFPLEVGDRILKMDGKDVYAFVQELCPTDLGQIEATKTILAMTLGGFTSLNCEMPTNPNVMLTILRDKENIEIQLPWMIRDVIELSQELSELSSSDSESSEDLSDEEVLVRSREKRQKTIKQYLREAEERILQVGDLSKTRFAVERITSRMLMAPLFNDEKKVEKKSTTSPDYLVVKNAAFDVRIYRRDAAMIGYIKIVDFGGGSHFEDKFKEAVADLDKFSVKGIVLDLVNNGGGSLEYGLELAKVFKGNTGSEPKLEVRLNDNWLNAVRMTAALSDNDLERQINKTRYRTFQDEAKANRWLSTPFFLKELMIPKILPVSKTRKVVLMVNEMCASMCDIFTADLKDNGVARIVGKQTMGAGGNVTQHAISPRMGFLLSQTESLVIRANGEYLENKGVQVDVPYEPTKEDVQSTKYNGFIQKAVDEALTWN